MSVQHQLDSGSFDAEWVYARRVVHAEVPAAGDRGLSSLAGGAAGGVGALLMLAVAHAVAHFANWPLDVRALTDAAVVRVLPPVQAPFAGFIAVASVGVLLGAGFGCLTRHLRRISGRLLFFSLATPVLWVFTQAFILRYSAPWAVRGLPIGSFVLGALAYGWCLALMPPMGEAREPSAR
jgi:hypothetical protein